MKLAISSILVMLMVGTLPPGGTFIDDNGSVHESNIEAIFAAGITVGCNPPDSTNYCPDSPVTRAEMATFLTRALKLPPTTTDHFTDDTTTIHQPSINQIATAGITVGCNPPDNTNYCPNSPVTRAEMATFLTRALKLPPTTTDHFTDDTTTIHQPSINQIATAGITVGCNPPDNTNYCPNSPVTRAEMATFLTRALKLTPIAVEPIPASTIAAIERAAWGAKDPLPGSESHSLERMTVHHTAVALYDNTGIAARIRSHQSFHQSSGFTDIAYHFIIDRYGNVFEGRSLEISGETFTNYDPAGHFLPVLEGDYNQQQPTGAQLESLAYLLAWAAQTYDLDPATISGHRDHASTTCPGDNLYDLLANGSLEQTVRELMLSPINLEILRGEEATARMADIEAGPR